MTDIDCGGVCLACASCYDNLKNQDETAIDCGGAACDSCWTSFSYRFTNPLGGGYYNYNAEKTDVVYQGDVFKIKVDEGTTSREPYLEFIAVTPGTYNLATSSYVWAGSSFGKYMYDYGSITLTSIDTINRKISGKFNFTGYNASANSPVSPYSNVVNDNFSAVKYHK